MISRSEYSILHQPRKRFITGLERGKVAEGIAIHVLPEIVGNIFDSDPRAFLDVRFVKNGGFFHGSQGFHIEGSAGEIDKNQYGAERLSGHHVRHLAHHLCDRCRRTVRHVDGDNSLALVVNESNAPIRRRAFRSWTSVCNHKNSRLLGLTNKQILSRSLTRCTSGITSRQQIGVAAGLSPVTLQALSLSPDRSPNRSRVHRI